ncbi:MAG: hypothetical protein L3J35_06490 [Bacteroidales bacterium]|nr:hypothetical protein [Bacteroidales bacterium]
MQTDSVIIMAWPQTPAKAIGMWYDAVTELFGFLKNGYYKAGHAAAVLVNHSTKELHYFDFGRYHMPKEYGRARNKETDPLLKIKTELLLSDKNEILNIDKILTELNNNNACHGEGPLYASILENVDFNSAFKYAKSIQNKDAVPYGPYEKKGTNCSRFITSIAKKSNPARKIRFRLSTSLLLTPLTKANVFASSDIYYKVVNKNVAKHKLTYKDQLKNFMLPYIIKSIDETEKQDIQNIQLPVNTSKALYCLNRKK